MKTCKAPDPDTLTPAFRLPPGSCDSHCHVFGPADVFPYAPDRAYTPPDAPFEGLQKLHRILGIDRAVIVHASCHGTDMTVTLDGIARSGGTMRGVAVVDGDITAAELQRLHAGGMRGVRFNFVRHLGGMPDMDVMDRVLALAEPLGWHVVLHLDAQDIVDLAPRIERIRVPFVIDHMGRVQATKGLEQEPFKRLLGLMENPLAWVKICGSERVSAGRAPFEDAIPFAQALLAAAPDRCLWGTDWPHPNIAHDMPNDGALVDLLARFTDDQAVLHKVLVENPTRLYWPETL
ncbi:putative TIM-barrel fold metal-dependent hydrolase [Humitalea rosea]|uniref:Putative TIM-barrel fold metal-dependent hydrolase n=1 Tax=Humitalea rosea TaxID=990373 RepID=A0A2W7J205_9PROT|nr:amidohydrolase family protein [Humitalea rosea]PZW45017.1 putative TIM-barrel fold metal-dependent hydrolase [Humitalea rosea]